MKRSARKTAKLSKSLNRRLNSYALAASATGVSLLALAQPAEAKIVYTKAHVVIGHGGHHLYRLDLNHDKVPDFLIGTNTSYTSNFRVFLSASGLRSNLVQGTTTTYLAVALKLPKAAKIDRNQKFLGWRMAELVQGHSTTYLASWNWCKPGPGYLGLKFRIAGKIHFGWARLNVVCHVTHLQGKPTITATLTGYAYETIGYKGIIAGKTKESEVITLTEPAGLGHLARGAPAIPAWRTNP